MNTGEGKKKKREREANLRTVLTIKEKLRTAGREDGGGWAKWMMGIKEDTCDEHWVLYTSDELLNSTPETNIILYVN